MIDYEYWLKMLTERANELRKASGKDGYDEDELNREWLLVLELQSKILQFMKDK